jgi:KUP system potassium uptake protein
VFAAIVFTVMLTWQRGRQLVTARRAVKEGPLLDFIAEVRKQNLPRVPGTAVFPHPNNQTTPLALRACGTLLPNS